MTTTRFGILAVIALCVTGGQSRAQTTYTWNDSTTDWTQSSVWTAAGPVWTDPTRLTDSIAAFGSRSTITNQPTIGGNTLYANGVTINNSGSGKWALTGTSGVLNVGSGGITLVTSSTTTSITANIQIAADQTWNIAGTKLTIGGTSNAGVLSGTGTLTKTGSGTLVFDNVNNTFFGNIIVSNGTLQAGSSTNSASSMSLRSNPVNLASGTSLTTVGGTGDLRVGQLTGSGSVTPGGTNGAVIIQALADATFSGAITTSNGLILRGANGTTQTFNGNLTSLTGTIAVNSGATLKLSGTGDSTSGVLGSVVLATRGGSFVLDNTSGNTSAAAGRLDDAATVTFLGGSLSLLGNSTSGTTENVGIVTLNDGAATVNVTHNGGSGGTVLNFANSGTFSLRSSTAMTVNFVGTGGTNLGASGANPRITFTGTPFTGTSTGLLSNTAGSDTTIGWATVNSTEWAGYGANGIVVVSPTLTTATNTGLQGATATSVTFFNPSVNQTLGAAVTTGTLKITPTASGLTLALGSNAVNTSAVMLAGSTDFTVSGTGQFANSSGTRYIYVTDPNTTLSVSAPLSSASPINKSGLGFLALTNTGNQLAFAANQNVNLLQGTLRGTTISLGRTGTDTTGSTSAAGPFTTLNFRGGVLEIKDGGTFVRAVSSSLVGTAAGGVVNWNTSSSARGDGGFSAINGATSVTLVTTVGGSTAATLTWNTGGFAFDGYALLFGSTKADSPLTLTNNIALDSGAGNYSAREIRVIDNTSSTTDVAILTGVVSGSVNSDLLKTGGGILELSGANTYSGNTLVAAGTFIISGNYAGNSGNYSGITQISTGATLQLGNAVVTGWLGDSAKIVNNGAVVFNEVNGTNRSYSGVISGTGTVTQAGTNFLTLSGTNTYTGATNITGSGSTLALANTGSISKSSTITVGSGATYDVSAVSSYTLGSSTAQSLQGTGSVTGAVTVASGGTIRGGTSSTVGTLTLSSPLTTLSGATIAVRVTDASVPSASLGGSNVGTLPNPTSHSFLNITSGTSVFNSGTKVSIDGTGTTFNASNSYSYTIATGAGNQSTLNINSTTSPLQFSTSNFSNASSFDFAVTGDSGGNVFLTFTPVPVPEPSAILGIAVAALGVGGFVRRRLRKPTEHTTAA